LLLLLAFDEDEEADEFVGDETEFVLLLVVFLAAENVVDTGAIVLDTECFDTTPLALNMFPYAAAHATAAAGLYWNRLP